MPKKIEQPKDNGLQSRPPIVVVMGHIDHGKCIHPAVQIPLANGLIKTAEEIWKEFSQKGVKIASPRPEDEIIHLKKGPQIFSWNGVGICTSRISHLWKIKINSPMIKFTLNSGDTITVTPEHPFLIFTEEGHFFYKKASDIKKDDFIVIPQTLPFTDADIKKIKTFILERLASENSFVAFLNRHRAQNLISLLKKTNKQELYRKKLFTTNPTGVLNHLRFRISNLISLADYFHLPISEIYDKIDGIKNANEKWRAGHTSTIIKLPNIPDDLRKLGRLIGFIIGDGHLDKNEVYIHNNDPEIQKFCISALKKIFNVEAKLLRGHTSWLVKSRGQKTLVRFLNAVFDIPIGNKSAITRIPAIVKISKCMREEVIAGIFDTDGYVSSINHSLELTSKSNFLIKDIGILLLEHGVHSTIFKKDNFWYLRIANSPYLEKFRTHYHLCVARKRERLNMAIRKAGTSRIFDITPINGEALAKIKISEKSFPYFNQYKLYNQLSRRFLLRLFQNHKDVFLRCFKNSELKSLINPGEISLVKIKDIKEINNVSYVYDFTVPKFKNFIAERMIIHNTTLLDFIRKTKITEKESGGITQHIGAYEIEVRPKDEPKSQESEASRGIPQKEILHSAQDDFAAKSRKITFIDTPGHEAFSKMRSRGARVADIAILVVAADEGVKEQTKEAIRHIKEAEIPFIVAINKIDKPGANPEKVKKELAESEVLVESWGGKIPSVEISAKSGEHIDELLELILIAAELEELKANPQDPASGIIIEARLDSRRGPLATLIVKNGTLRTGDYIAAGNAEGRVKFLENDRGQTLKEAVFSMPALCGGFESVPQVGEEFFSHHQRAALENLMAEKIKLTLIEPTTEEASAKKSLKIVLKADVSGSLEALADSLSALSQEDIGIQFIKKEVGEINESDVKLAGAAGGVIIGFRVKIPQAIQNFSRERKIEIVTSDIIYELLEKVKKLMKEAVGPKIQRLDLGRMKVLAIFRTEKNRMIVGGKVLSGKLEKGAKIEVLRNNEIVGTGRPVELQQDKKEVGEVKEGKECGVLFEGNVKIETGDILNFYREETKKIII